MARLITFNKKLVFDYRNSVKVCCVLFTRYLRLNFKNLVILFLTFFLFSLGFAFIIPFIYHKGLKLKYYYYKKNLILNLRIFFSNCFLQTLIVCVVVKTFNLYISKI